MSRIVPATLFIAIALAALRVNAEDGILHIVRPGESLVGIAELYYGDGRRDGVLATENGLDGHVTLAPGMRLTIPAVRYHRVEDGDTWASLSERYYGDVRRAFLLAESNGGAASKQPAFGSLLLVPYPLRYTSNAHDPVRQAARDFLDLSAKTLAMLRRFNGLASKSSRLGRGDVVLVPMSNLLLSEQGRKLAQAQGHELAQAAAAREKQIAAHDELPALRKHVQQGRYVEAVALAHQLLGAGQLTGNQLVTIQRELGTALIALDREDLALEAFKALLMQQPDVELGLGDTSPRVLAVLDRAKRALSDPKTRARAAKAAPAPAKPVAGAQ